MIILNKKYIIFLIFFVFLNGCISLTGINKNPKIQKLVKGFYQDIEKANKLGDEVLATLKKQGYEIED